MKRNKRNGTRNKNHNQKQSKFKPKLPRTIKNKTSCLSIIHSDYNIVSDNEQYCPANIEDNKLRNKHKRTSRNHIKNIKNRTAMYFANCVAIGEIVIDTKHIENT